MESASLMDVHNLHTTVCGLRAFAVGPRCHWLYFVEAGLSTFLSVSLFHRSKSSHPPWHSPTSGPPHSFCLMAKSGTSLGSSTLSHQELQCCRLFLAHNECIVTLLLWCSSVCLSGTGVHCDHTVHFRADLSLWLNSPMFWAPWH